MKNNQLLQLLIDDELNNQSLFCYKLSSELLSQKISLFTVVFERIKLLLEDLEIKNINTYVKTFWYFWFPLALDLAQKKEAKSNSLIVGILGGQGTGKTTLTKILAHIWQCLGLNSIELSLDDLYKTYQERQDLLKVDSRLIWRGPPGTHDVSLGLDILDRFQKQTYPILIPRFDKSLYNGMGDRVAFEKVGQGDIIILEGWFVGMQPVSETAFINPPYPIISEEDKQFAFDNNKRLKKYLSLWEKLDYFMILKPKDYRYSLKWRKEAEHKMIKQGKTGMSDMEIEQFVHYFWKALHPEIYLPPLLNNSQYTDLIININTHHSIESVKHFH
ncbi:glycerate kinase [Geminocystis sp. NIES-3709]|uniref:glycerate kinase n=1 Tax=Geminocystis sp. NIES-3709 TaxID=1617448 RepID=UPI0005FCBDB3|nr:glycerate kinase [Geminocystis sp. NIES-3709]BAQ65390.1 D-glycerate 3-kinase [Geminocystis sp. NIES-3709]